MVHAEVEEGKMSESARGLPDKGRWTKEGNVRRCDQDRTEKEDMEIANEVNGENACSPKRQKNLRMEQPGEKPPERTRSRTRALVSQMV
jgi:hypothetical protein